MRLISSAKDDDHQTPSTHLETWWLNLPEVLQHNSGADEDEDVLPCILVHRSALQIYYQYDLPLGLVTGRQEADFNL